MQVRHCTVVDPSFFERTQTYRDDATFLMLPRPTAGSTFVGRPHPSRGNMRRRDQSARSDHGRTSTWAPPTGARSVVWGGLALILFAIGPRARGSDDAVAAMFTKFFAQQKTPVESIDIGRSTQGHAITALRAGKKDAPALLVVAGEDGRHRAGPEIALAALSELMASQPALLEKTAVYFVPCLNPDAYLRVIAARSQPPVAKAPVEDGGALRPYDDDRDGVADEDPACDLNKDGAVTWMRVFDPKPPYERTHVVDPSDPRKSREADRAKGEVPQFALLRESEDKDGDGRFGEDAIGGVDLDKNFPHAFVEAGARSGPWALSEPETRSLVDWMLAREDIEGVLVIGTSDNLVNLPEAGKTDITKRAPNSFDRADQTYAVEIQKKALELTGWKKAKVATVEGALHSWAYAQYGVLAFTLDLTRDPARDNPSAPSATDAEKGGKDKAEKKDGDAGKAPAPTASAETPAAPPTTAPPSQAGTPPTGGAGPGAGRGPGGGGGRRGGGRGPGGGFGGGFGGGAQGGADEAAPSAKDDTDAALFDAAVKEGKGFVAYTKFDHPQLGAVEIGGLTDDFKLNPPESAWPELGKKVALVASEMLKRLPHLTLGKPKVDVLGDGVFRIVLEATNDGGLPIPLAIGERLRRKGQVAMRLELPRERIPSGRIVQTLPTLVASGGHASAEWMVLGKPDETVTITVRAPQIGVQKLDVKLTATGGER